MTLPRLRHSLGSLLIAAACASLATAVHAADTTPASPVAATQAKHAITHEDVWLMKRVGAPVASPDGKWAVFSVVDSTYSSQDQWSDLWIKSLLDDSPARRLTYSKSGESAVAWSPDSRQLVFVAKRDGDEAGQIYRLDVAAGGEAQRLTSLTLGARMPKWSPDGKQLLFISDIYPGNKTEADVKQSAKERKERKVSARSYETTAPRHFDKWLTDSKRLPTAVYL
jgi:dipeptidyl aminopeptidase/acylaminoacyl peptidase